MIEQIVKDNTVDLIKKVCYFNETDSSQFVNLYNCLADQISYDGGENQLAEFSYLLVLTLQLLLDENSSLPSLAESLISSSGFNSDTSNQFKGFVETVVLLNLDRGATVRKLASLVFEDDKPMLDFFDAVVSHRNKEQK